MRWLALLLLLACTTPGMPDPDQVDLTPEQVARGFAYRVLEQPDLEQALRWTEPSASLEVRSQFGFLAGREQVEYSVGVPSKEASRWLVVVPIRRVQVGPDSYRGQLRLDLGEDGRRVVHSSLRLTRPDGVELSL
ncbi:MAG: hypothetical protein AB1758_36660 [Candidatus Eremiobacterota bacterium]